MSKYLKHVAYIAALLGVLWGLSFQPKTAVADEEEEGTNEPPTVCPPGYEAIEGISMCRLIETNPQASCENGVGSPEPLGGGLSGEWVTVAPGYCYCASGHTEVVQGDGYPGENDWAVCCPSSVSPDISLNYLCGTNPPGGWDQCPEGWHLSQNYGYTTVCVPDHMGYPAPYDWSKVVIVDWGSIALIEGLLTSAPAATVVIHVEDPTKCAPDKVYVGNKCVAVCTHYGIPCPDEVPWLLPVPPQR